MLARPLLAVALAASFAALAADKPAPQAVHDKISMCTGCHGIPGYKTAFPKVYHVPKIGGQNPAYLASALKAYRAGDRWHPSMRGIAASLSDQDIEQLAEYYGRPK